MSEYTQAPMRADAGGSVVGDLSQALARASMAMSMYTAAGLAVVGVSGAGFRALRVLEDGPCTSAHLARATGITPQAIILSNPALERDGHITRQRRLGAPGRTWDLVITEEGRRVLVEARELIARTESALRDALGPAEYEQMISHLRLTAKALGGMHAAAKSIR